MRSVDDERDAATRADDTALAFFDLGEQLAAILSNLNEPYGWQAAQEYRRVRHRLRTIAQVFGAMIKASPHLMEEAMNDAFPQTLADVYETAWKVGVASPGHTGLVSRWRPEGWHRLEETVLTIFDAFDYDPAVAAPVATQAKRQDPRKARIEERRRKVLDLTDQGLTNDAIARDLKVNERTIYLDKEALRGGPNRKT